MKLNAKLFEQLTVAELYEILRARSEVFLLEQGIICLDQDGVDYRAMHCFFEENGKILAYLRAFPEENDPRTAHIGRVLTTVRGKGLGKELMQKSLLALKQQWGCDRFLVHAQTQAAGFYKKLRFEKVSDTYLEEGVEHVTMALILPTLI